ncbi:MAG: hypothetical protein KBS59_03505 [Clostridiales bacterium]|nr:hypothetical protein [Clostridiales bacterium]
MKKAKKTALSAICASLCVVILYICSFFEVLDISSAYAASILVLFIVTELGIGYATGVYASVTVLSLLILPQKLPALLFALFFGIQPVTKRVFEHIGTKIGAVLSYVMKLALFEVELVAFGYLARELLEIPENKIIVAAYIVLANLIFILGDILYGKLVRIYRRYLRNRIIKYLK